MYNIYGNCLLLHGRKTALIAEKMATNWKAKIGHIVSVGMNPIKLNFEPFKNPKRTPNANFHVI